MDINTVLNKLGVSKKSDYLVKLMTIALKRYDALLMDNVAGDAKDDDLFLAVAKLGNLFYNSGAKTDLEMDEYLNRSERSSFIEKQITAFKEAYGVTGTPQYANYPYANTFTEEGNGHEVTRKQNLDISHQVKVIGKWAVNDNVLKQRELKAVSSQELFKLIADEVKGSKVVDIELKIAYLLICKYNSGSHRVLISSHELFKLGHQSRAMVISVALLESDGDWINDRYACPVTIKHLTDIKRIFGFLSQGMLELVTTIRFVKPPKEILNVLTREFLDKINEDELSRGQEVWKKISYIMGIKQNATSEDKWSLIKRLHDKTPKLRSFESNVNALYATRHLSGLIVLLVSRPNELLINMTKILSEFESYGMAALKMVPREIYSKMSVGRLLEASAAFSRSSYIPVNGNNGTVVPTKKIMSPELSEHLLVIASDVLQDRIRSEYGNSKIVITSKLGDVIRCGIPKTTQKDDTNMGLPNGTSVVLGKANEVSVSMAAMWDAHVDIDLSMVGLTKSAQGVFNWRNFRSGSTDTLYHSGDNRDGGKGSIEYLCLAEDELSLPGHYALADVVNYSNSKALKDIGVTVALGLMPYDNVKAGWSEENTLFKVPLDIDNRRCNPFMVYVNEDRELILYVSNVSAGDWGVSTTEEVSKMYREVSLNTGRHDVCGLLGGINTDATRTIELDINSGELRKLFA